MRSTAAVVVVALAFGVAAPVRGETEAEKDGRELFHAANRQFKAQDYVGALELFRAAHAKLKSPKLFLSIGTTLRRLGRDVEAADAYDRFLREAKPDRGTRVEVESALAELDAHLGRLRLSASAPGAKLAVDGRTVGESPAEVVVRVTPGEHEVTATRPGLSPARATVTVAAGALLSVTLRPEAAPASAPAPAPASAPAPLLAVPRADSPSFARRHRVSLVLGVTAVVLAGVGTGLGASTASSYSDMARTCAGTVTGCAKADVDSAKDRALVTNIMFAAAGAAAVTAVVYYLFVERRRERPGRLTLGPVLGGAGLVGRY
jgi:hypothetical protein